MMPLKYGFPPVAISNLALYTGTMIGADLLPTLGPL
ncbi:Phosphoenolpyruvate carboxylase, type 1 [secondary endosymbiont of Ctenarytaina eucalypti]|uniref:Phosphoenolpyruvate carboxylase, type 1 n=1 Tax=secondary endosymbiont of Ctenarytaina eucalypti TaxID=1199245 RepID=J3TEW8_9ENTR|nr:Phosphoenolpyruvate carboxylase, type 1 [secondary endosymbiont of Ctenarytaina eucalypti]